MKSDWSMGPVLHFVERSAGIINLFLGSTPMSASHEPGNVCKVGGTRTFFDYFLLCNVLGLMLNFAKVEGAAAPYVPAVPGPLLLVGKCMQDMNQTEVGYLPTYLLAIYLIQQV